MKSYKECAESVLRRRDEHLDKVRRKRGIIIRSTSALACVCVAAGIIIIAPWNRGEAEAPPAGGTETARTVTTDTEASRAGESADKAPSRIVVSYTSSKKGDWIIVPPSVGEVYVFPDLAEARAEFSGQDVRFLVFIDIIDENGWYLLEEEKEAEYTRLEALGYESANVFADIPDDADFRRSRAFNLTEAQIADFAASEEYGYLLRFTGMDEEEHQDELGFVEMADGSVCMVLLSDGEVSMEKYVDSTDTETVPGTLSEDLG